MRSQYNLHVASIFLIQYSLVILIFSGERMPAQKNSSFLAAGVANKQSTEYSWRCISHCIVAAIEGTLQRRHNERDGVSNH